MTTASTATSSSARIAEPSLEAIRARFPALAGAWALLENAGGSQVPACVADAMHRYMLERYVQLGAGYPMSDEATATVAQAHEFIGTVFNGNATGDRKSVV